MTAKLANNAKNGTSTDVETTEVQTAMFDFLRKDLRFLFSLEEAKDLILSDELFLINALKGACEKAAYRNAGEKNALPDAGLIDLAKFVTTVKGFAFRGEEKPSKADKKDAADFLKKLAEKAVTPAQMSGWFAKKGYPVADLELNTLEITLMRMRLDAEEAAREKREADIREMQG